MRYSLYFVCLLLCFACGGTGSDNGAPTDTISEWVDMNQAPDTVGEDSTTLADSSIKEDATQPNCEETKTCFGDPCGTDADCPSGWCVDHLGDGVCSEKCTTECPDGFTCTELKITDGDSTFVCTSNTPTLCRPCNTTDDCKSTHGIESDCVSYGDIGSYCGAVCTADIDCPDGYTCEVSTTATGAESNQCQSTTAECSCTDKSISIGASTSCHNTNAAGSCQGNRSCTADGLSDCSAVAATDEICNAIDDNCDSNIDEGTCNDQDQCTVDVCNGESGCSNDINVGATCDDASLDTANDTCNASGDCVGTPIECEADTACVVYTKNGTDCTPAYSDGSVTCDDSDDTTTNDVCDGAGGCKGDPISCPKDTQCTTYTPNGTDCTASYADASVGCDDSDDSTANDTCDGAGGCGGDPILCDAPSQCITGYKTDGNVCVPIYADSTVGCDDKNNATANDVCDGAGGCKGDPIACPKDTQCTTYTPNGTDCTPSYADTSVGCNDGNNNTTNDVCDGAGGCGGDPISCPKDTQCITYTANGTDCTTQYAPANTPCNDNNPNTENDVCHANGVCSGSSTVNCPPPPQCAVMYTGPNCTVVGKPAGTPCDDGLANTENDVCNGTGFCSGTEKSLCGTPPKCVDAIFQINGECLPMYSASGSFCSDGNVNSIDDQCDGLGNCKGTVVATCDPPPECVYALVGVNCEPAYEFAGTSCNDNNPNTGNDVCDGNGVCAGSQTVDLCPPPPQCVVYYHQLLNACMPILMEAGTACNDGNPNTTNDQCDPIGNCSGTP